MKCASLNLKQALIWLVLCSLMLIVGWLLYEQTAHFQLVWDDKTYLEDVGAQRGGNFLAQVLTSNFFVSNDYYRPLVQSSILIQWLWYENAGVLHITNVIIHILNSILVMILACLVAGRIGLAHARHSIAVFAALIYIAHPSLVESVAWISGRFDLTVTFFILLLLVIERLWRGESFAKFVTLGIVFLLAALSKEMAVALPLLMPFWLIFWHENEDVRSMREVIKPLVSRYALSIYVALVCGGLVYLTIRWAALGYLYSGKDAIELVEPNLIQKFLLVVKSYGWYSLLSVWPAPYVSAVHPEKLPLAVSDYWAWSSLLVLVFCMVLIYRMWCRGFREALLLLIALVALLPASNLLRLPVGENIVQDRFLTLPLAFFGVFLAILFFRFFLNFNPAKKFFLMVLVVGWYTFLPLNTRLIVPMWSNDVTLWTWAKNQYPDNYRAALNVTASLIRVKNYEDCDRLTSDVLQLKKTAEAYMNRGACLDALGRFAEAEVAFMTALDGNVSKSYYAIILVNIADLQMKQKKPDDVLSLLEEAEKILPGYLRTYMVGARFLDSTQQFTAADYYYSRLLGVLTASERVRMDAYLKRRQACIESTGRACEEVVPGDRVVDGGGHV